MTQPRFLPGKPLVMVTRRTVLRTYLFRPDATITNTYAYLLAWAARKHSVKVVAATLMSTHEHLIVEAPDGNGLAAFLRDMHRLVALATKVYRNWPGAVWDHEETSVVVLRTKEALIEKIAYVMANPVAAGCVPRAHLWPGLCTKPEQLGDHLMAAKKPAHFVDQRSAAWADALNLDLQLPETFDLNPRELRECVAAELKRLEDEARAEMVAAGRKWEGVERARTASPKRSSRTREAPVKRNPSFAVGRHNASAMREAAEDQRLFRDAYRWALERWRSGVRDTPFPLGTVAMVALHGVLIAAAS